MKKTSFRPFWFKPVLIICSVLLGISALLGGAVAYFRLPVQSYYNASDALFKIPDIDNGYVPQGMHYEWVVDENTAYYVLSGYMSNDKPSPLYLLDMYGQLKTGVTLTVEDENGEFVDYYGHCGGVAVYKNWVYVTGDCKLIVYDFKELCNAESGAKLKPLGSISLKKSDTDYVKTSFVTVYENKLITGEFYRENGNNTLESHAVKTKAGEVNHALAVEYSLNQSSYKKNFGLASSPSKVYSLPDKVQGIALTDDEMYLSTSYHLAFSNIFQYQRNDIVKGDNEVTVFGEKFSVYELNSQNVTKTYKIAPMSEEIAIVNSKLVVNCESACNKYIVGKFTGSKFVYATKLHKLK